MWKILIAIAALIYALFYAVDVILVNGREIVKEDSVKEIPDDKIEDYII